MTTDELYKVLDARLERIETALSRISERVGLHGELIAADSGETRGRRAIMAAVAGVVGGAAGAVVSALLAR